MRTELARLYRSARASARGRSLAREAFVVRRHERNICRAINILTLGSLTA